MTYWPPAEFPKITTVGAPLSGGPTPGAPPGHAPGAVSWSSRASITANELMPGVPSDRSPPFQPSASQYSVPGHGSARPSRSTSARNCGATMKVRDAASRAAASACAR